MRRNTTPLPGYRHPSETAHKAGCGCVPCRTMRTRRDKRRIAQMIRTGPVLTDVAPLADVLRGWTAEGFSSAVIATLVRVDESCILDYESGEIGRMRADTARRIRAITRDDLYAVAGDRCYVPSIGASRRVRALLRIGWTHELLSEASAVGLHTLHDVVSMRRPKMMAASYHGVVAVFEKLCMTVGPSRYSAGRARSLGYLPPLAWDDDIDDPAATPSIYGEEDATRRGLYRAGLSDIAIATEEGVTRDAIRVWRKRNGLEPNYKPRGRSA